MGRINFSPQIAQLNNGSAGAQLQSNAIDTMVKAVSDYAKGDGQTKEQRELAKLQLEDALLRKDGNLTRTAIDTAKITNENLNKTNRQNIVKEDIVKEGGPKTVDAVITSGLSVDDKAAMTFSKLFDEVKQINTVDGAKAVKSNIDKYNDILTPAQQEAIRKEFDTGVASLAKQFNTTGTNEQKNIYSSPRYKEAVYDIEKEAQSTVDGTDQMKVRDDSLKKIAEIKVDKTMSKEAKSSAIAKVQDEYTKYFKKNKEAFADIITKIDEDKTAKLDNLGKEYQSNFSTLTNLLSATAKADMDTYINGEKKNLETATAAFNTADKAIYQGRADELIKPITTAKGTKVLGKEQLLKEMVKVRQAQEDEDRKKYGGPKTKVTLNDIKKDLFDDGLEFDQTNIFKRYEDVRQEIVKPRLAKISDELTIEGKRISNKINKLSLDNAQFEATNGKAMTDTEIQNYLGDADRLAKLAAAGIITEKQLADKFNVTWGKNAEGKRVITGYNRKSVDEYLKKYDSDSLAIKKVTDDTIAKIGEGDSGKAEKIKDMFEVFSSTAKLDNKSKNSVLYTALKNSFAQDGKYKIDTIVEQLNKYVPEKDKISFGKNVSKISNGTYRQNDKAKKLYDAINSNTSFSTPIEERNLFNDLSKIKVTTPASFSF